MSQNEHEYFVDLYNHLQEICQPEYWQTLLAYDEIQASRCVTAAIMGIDRALGLLSDLEFDKSEIKDFLNFRREKLIGEAAKRLDANLSFPSRPEWLCSVGHDQNHTLHVFVTETNKQVDFVAQGFEGFRVKVNVVPGGFIAGPAYKDA